MAAPPGGRTPACTRPNKMADSSADGSQAQGGEEKQEPKYRKLLLSAASSWKSILRMASSMTIRFQRQLSAKYIKRGPSWVAATHSGEEVGTRSLCGITCSSAQGRGGCKICFAAHTGLRGNERQRTGVCDGTILCAVSGLPGPSFGPSKSAVGGQDPQSVPVSLEACSQMERLFVGPPKQAYRS